MFDFFSIISGYLKENEGFAWKKFQKLNEVCFYKNPRLNKDYFWKYLMVNYSQF